MPSISKLLKYRFDIDIVIFYRYWRSDIDPSLNIAYLWLICVCRRTIPKLMVRLKSDV